jgi:hypothetical protein
MLTNDLLYRVYSSKAFDKHRVGDFTARTMRCIGIWVSSLMSADDKLHVLKKELLLTVSTPQVTAARHSSERATGIQGTGEHSVTTEDYCGLITPQGLFWPCV